MTLLAMVRDEHRAAFKASNTKPQFATMVLLLEQQLASLKAATVNGDQAAIAHALGSMGSTNLLMLEDIGAFAEKPKYRVGKIG